MGPTRYASAFDLAESGELLNIGAPTFGGPPVEPAMPAPEMAAPAMPAAPPAMAPPGMRPPSFAPPQMAQPMSKGRELAMLIPALLMGLKRPEDMGAALRGLQQGKDRRLALMETQQQQAERRTREQADFYARALENAAQFDDEIAFTEWKRGITPMAEYFGIPAESFVFSQTKKAAKDRKLVQEAVDRAIRLHGPEVLNRDDVSVQLSDGRTFNMATARAMLGDVTDASGKSVPVPGKVVPPFTPTTPAEMRIAAYARSLGKKVEDLTPEELDKAKGEPDAASAGASDFDRHLQRHYAAVKAKLGRDLTPAELVSEELVAKKQFQQADDKGPDPLLQEIRALTAANLRNARLSPAQESAARALADDFTRDTKDYQIRLDSLLTLREIMKAPSAAGDIALVFAFMKLQDPNSAVRETEYANAQNAAGVPERIRNLWNKVKDGEFLTDSQRRDFLSQSQAIFRAARSKYDITRKSYEQKARARNIDPSLVIVDYDALLGDGDTPVTPTPDAAPPPATPTTGSRIKSVTRVR